MIGTVVLLFGLSDLGATEVNIGVVFDGESFAENDGEDVGLRKRA